MSDILWIASTTSSNAKYHAPANEAAVEHARVGDPAWTACGRRINIPELVGRRWQPGQDQQCQRCGPAWQGGDW